ncbi:YdcF family protein [Sodalis ligni]|uniref:YdcF family protein n=1 Tax=Sodalis ligni TaxID=2697027 RepID=UPI001BDEBF72|nr:ElyC/SanA/YdcF family protein [Sodalis ligni]QWA10851.1 YdcF family protein [Sodalis ligni]
MHIEDTDSSNPAPFNDELITAVNIIAAWLAVDDLSAQLAHTCADIIILAGNAVLATIDGACTLANKYGIPLVITGGIGHSTSFLETAVAQHPRYRVINTRACPEANILHDIATTFRKVPSEQIYLENATKNTGEKALCSRALLEKLSLTPKNVILIQEPLLQRRTDATFQQTWLDSTHKPTFTKWPTYIPRLTNTIDGVGFAGDDRDELWPVNRFLSLLIGEVPRLRDDKQGYGPKGKNYIGHLDIPDAIEEAWQKLMQNKLLSVARLNRIMPV